MRYVHIDLRRSETDTARMQVPAWEIPVLAIVHGQESIKEIGEETIDRVYPDPQGEYVRLEQRYGVHTKSETPHVAIAYGPTPARLAEAIKLEQESEVRARRKKGPVGATDFQALDA